MESRGTQPADIVLETPRLILRRFSVDDADFVLRLLNEPSFIEHIADKGVRTTGDARDYLLKGPLASYARYGFGLWRVSLREGAVPIGMCGLIKRDALEDVDLGYAFVPEHSSKGYALEAATAAVSYAQSSLGLTRVVAVVNSENARSIRLLAKLGFHYERMIRLSDAARESRLLACALPLRPPNPGLSLRG